MMKPTLSMLGRRALLHAALTAVAWHPPELATAISPPKGSTYLLVPLVEQRILLAESTTAIQRPDANWTSLLGLFHGPPFTGRAAGGRYVVGSLFRDAAAQYEASLVYSTQLTVDDIRQCFPRRDDECLRLQTDSDRLFRELLINDVMSKLQAVEEELTFLSNCERGLVSKGQGLMCPEKGTAAELEELSSCLRAAGGAFDRYFDVVPAEDARAAVGIVAKASPRWDLIPIDDVDGR